VSLLLRHVLLGDRRRDVLIEGNRIAGLDGGAAEETIDCSRLAAIPGLVNTHTHAAMALLRGYAEDLDLKTWLEKRIWPMEAKLTPDDVYWGTKLACLEMIRTGTTAFNDMYFHMDRAAQAAKEMGLRGVLSEGFIDLGRKEAGDVLLHRTREVHRRIRDLACDRLSVAWGPHAWYTVSRESMAAIGEAARDEEALIHVHVSETRQEVEDCRRAHGLTPLAYLDSLGIVADRTVAAHGCWLTEEDAQLLARRGASVSHNPVSNMKLASGRLDMPMLAYHQVNLALGTDGAASNNALSLMETMKFAALLQKHAAEAPTIVDARHILSMATAGGARALHLDAGEIAPGRLADIVLFDLRSPGMVPAHSVTANVVYASPPVSAVICDGKFLMRDGNVPGEAEILEKAGKVAADLIGRG
jgi:5-methylthioadenosine/S-adenosylhomocysteine deaminase